MTSNVRAIPEGFHSLTPSITCRDAARAIEFYKKAFGAREISRMLGPGGTIAHAELRIGDSVIFVADEWPGMSAAPAPTSTPSFYLFLYTEDVDSVYNRAVAAGCHVAMPLQNMFWGDRYGKLTDPFGYQWGVGMHIEDVSPEELQRRSAEFAANMAKAAGKS
jgi:PhnB protein